MMHDSNTISGWVDRTDRARLQISGPDRAKFLHNLTTNDVKRLAAGHGQESFVTTLQGKVLAYVTLLASDDAILLRTEAGSLEGLAPHLARYGVFDDVVIDDVSSDTFEFPIFGPQIDSFLEAQGLSLPIEKPLGNVIADFNGDSIRVTRESLTPQPGFTLIGRIQLAATIKQMLLAAGIHELDLPSFDSLRIEAGIPLSGRDVTLANLPQEVGRDSRTINFVKGCYLGQETVARLDALGHVNRIFRGLTLEGTSTVPPDGTPLSFEGKVVGSITSSAVSKALGCPIALGYVKVAQAVAGTKLRLTIEGSDEAEAIVRDLPIR